MYHDPLELGFSGYTEEEGRAILLGAALAGPTTADFPCVHRGEKIRDGSCNLCGIRGQPFEVLSCSIYGECSIGKRHSNVRACIGCERLSLARD